MDINIEILNINASKIKLKLGTNRLLGLCEEECRKIIKESVERVILSDVIDYTYLTNTSLEQFDYSNLDKHEKTTVKNNIRSLARQGMSESEIIDKTGYSTSVITDALIRKSKYVRVCDRQKTI